MTARVPTEAEIKAALCHKYGSEEWAFRLQAPAYEARNAANRAEMAALLRAAYAARKDGPAGETFSIEHDGFVGTRQGSYVTREGKRGVVLQQVGTRVVHVYGEKWLKPVDVSALEPATEDLRGALEAHDRGSLGDYKALILTHIDHVFALLETAP